MLLCLSLASVEDCSQDSDCLGDTICYNDGSGCAQCLATGILGGIK